MNRYRTYGPQDDQSLEEGDAAFVGVNSYDIAENLQPGQAQAAVNMDFTQSTAATRGGFVCLPYLGTTPFRSWTIETSANNYGWSSVAYGNGGFVAVAQDTVADNVMTSSDGVTWTARNSSGANQWNCVVYALGQYLAVGSGVGVANQVMTSPDGITWTARNSAEDNPWFGVTYGAGKFVAVATSGTHRAMYSTDGITWTAATMPAGAWASVAYGNGIFVALAETAVATSLDGITWTSGTVASSDNWLRLAYGNGTFVATAYSGSGGRVMTSTDGLTWTARTQSTTAAWYNITFGQRYFVAVGTNATMVSSDGANWATVTAAVSNQWSGVTYGNGKFVATSATGTGNRAMLMYEQSVFASGTYSDPNARSVDWMVLVGPTQAGFYAFGQTARTIAYPAGFTVTQQATVVQAGGELFIFPGVGQTPVYWNGDWSGAFVAVPNATVSTNSNIPQSNQATYYQNRLFVVKDKDEVSVSDILSFTDYDPLSADFNLNTGTSDYVVRTYPFGENGMVVFKHKSSLLLQNVQGNLYDVTATEITRQLGIIGINACTAVGPDLIYVSDRNITSIRLNLQNQLQGVTEPLSRNIKSIIGRINWNAADRVSMAYWDNKLFVALPLDNVTYCNSIVVYNFVTQQWWGEWNFASGLGLAIQGFLVANYLGAIRLHCVSEDGRIFVVNEGQNDISGTALYEISASLTTRAYRLDNNSHVPRRMYMDVGTNRPTLTVTAYAEGASESSAILTNQTYLRSQSWLFNDSTYNLNNSSDDFNRAFRKDYSTGSIGTGTTPGLPTNGVQCGSGILPEMLQEYRFPLITRRKGRLSWFKVANTTGVVVVNGVGLEARPGDRSSFVQVG